MAISTMKTLSWRSEGNYIGTAGAVVASACASDEMPSVIWGKPGSPIENIEFQNVRLTAKGGHAAAEAAKVGQRWGRGQQRSFRQA